LYIPQVNVIMIDSKNPAFAENITPGDQIVHVWSFSLRQDLPVPIMGWEKYVTGGINVIENESLNFSLIHLLANISTNPETKTQPKTGARLM
jgi:hypothetical protein